MCCTLARTRVSPLSCCVCRSKNVCLCELSACFLNRANTSLSLWIKLFSPLFAPFECALKLSTLLKMFSQHSSGLRTEGQRGSRVFCCEGLFFFWKATKWWAYLQNVCCAVVLEIFPTVPSGWNAEALYIDGCRKVESWVSVNGRQILFWATLRVVDTAWNRKEKATNKAVVILFSAAFSGLICQTPGSCLHTPAFL